MKFILWYAVYWGVTFAFRFSPWAAKYPDLNDKLFVALFEWILFFVLWNYFIV